MDIIAHDPTMLVMFLMACTPLIAFAVILLLGLCRIFKTADEEMERNWRQYLKDHNLEG